ncbi:glycoside hydrolase [Marinomonas agarivorans]|nr:glycoside hydrolase [Marinomonas agarivorans]
MQNTPVACVEPHYLSFSIDISVLVGGYWWEGSQKIHKGLGALRVPPINLNQKKLDQLVKALGPAYLRVGGSEADKIHYFSSDEEGSLLLTKQIWDDLHEFIQRNHLKFTFTFKYGLFKRKEHGAWQGSEIQNLLEYTHNKGYQIDVCELGNELNAYWAFHGLTSQPKAQKLAADYARFIEQIRSNLPNCRISGPGSAFWPRLGETIKPFSNITDKFLASLEHKLDIIDWHYYPFQSTRSPVRTRTATIQSVLSPDSLEDYVKYAQQLRTMRDKYQPQAMLWTGETGSAQCGGQQKISDRFASSFWWADQLGQGAVCGQSVMIRQSLIGGDYGLIDRLTLKPKPDYWMSWLWGKLMGQLVFPVTSSDKYVRVYCHRSQEKQHTDNNGAGCYTLLIINMSDKTKLIDYSGFGVPHCCYELRAKKLTAKKVFINGVRPKLKKGKLSLEDLPTLPITNEVAPYSINFWCFGD